MTHSIHFESSCIVFHLQSQFRFDNESVATLGEPAARVNQCHFLFINMVVECILGWIALL